MDDLHEALTGERIAGCPLSILGQQKVLRADQRGDVDQDVGGRVAHFRADSSNQATISGGP